ncbi:hypothetical protein TWF718_009329 [Orbilia javanica]|uniref:Uncharacterized protein n=1 Tax=Orbilia javanica TaxID=47235 RepID=A0AAN8MND8_9PEZI
MGYIIWNRNLTITFKEIPFLNYNTDHLSNPIYVLGWAFRFLFLFGVCQLSLLTLLAIYAKVYDFVREYLVVKGYIYGDSSWFGEPSTWRDLPRGWKFRDELWLEDDMRKFMKMKMNDRRSGRFYNG